MSSNKKTNWEEQKIREWIRVILVKEALRNTRKNERAIVSEQASSDLYNTFVAPFADVVNVASVAAKDIASAAKLNFDLLFAFSSKAQEEAWGNYNTRKEKIDAEYDEAMASTNAVLEGGDAKLLAFMAAPHMFLGVKGAQAIKSSGKSGAQFLNDSGWAKISVGGLEVPEYAEKESGLLGKAGGLVRDLANVFFVTHYAPPGPVLREAGDDDKKGDKKGDKKEEKATDPVDDIKAWFDEIGLTKKVEQDAQELFDAKIEVIKSTVEEAEQKIDFTNNLIAATSMEELKTALEKANGAGLDIGGEGLDAYEQKLDQSVDDMVNDPDAAENLKDEIEKSGGKVQEGEEAPAEISEDVLRAAAEKIVFVNAKEELQLQLEEGRDDFLEEAAEIVAEDIPEDDFDIMSQTRIGKDLIDVYNDGKARLQSLKQTA